MFENVVFCRWRDEKKVAQELGDCYILSPDGWNDFGFHTYFHVTIFKDGEMYNDFGRKILFEGQDESVFSSTKIEDLLKDLLYIPMATVKDSLSFISLGYEYEELIKIFPSNFEDILNVLNDVIYLTEKVPDSTLLELKKLKGFEVSLCRDQSSKKVLEEGRAILFGDILDPERFKFTFNFNLNERNYQYNFDFIEQNLPSRINVLVGKNGSGKSQTLLAISQYFLQDKDVNEDLSINVDKHPNFISNLMIFAYNIYENFYVSHPSEKLPIEYQYLGYRLKDDDDIITTGSNIPTIRTFYSFAEIYKKDRKNYAHSIHLNELSYRNKVIETLQKAFPFNRIALKLKDSTRNRIYSDVGFEVYRDFVLLKNESATENFVKDLNFEDFIEELYFFNNQNQTYLSSGQQTFVHLVINLLSLIKKNSLILIDEPENTLHPNLEIDFLRILKDILEDFDSFAIIATHSSIVVRETPSNYVRIIKIDDNNQPVIMPPSINTFGADIRKITNYVFDDVFIEEKPFLHWLNKQKENYNSFDSFEANFEELLNYNILAKAKTLWNDQ